MTRHLTELMQLKAGIGDTRLPIRALFHDRETLQLQQVAVDVGSWRSRHEVLVAVDRFDPPGHEVWPMSLSEDDLQNAPEWEHSSATGGLPPLVTGPFGYTFSPMMMAAGLAASAERSSPTAPDDETHDIVGQDGGRLAGLERSGDLLGQDAFSDEGRIGAVTDLVFDDHLRMTALMIGEDDPAEWPLTRLRHRAEQGHFVFD